MLVHHNKIEAVKRNISILAHRCGRFMNIAEFAASRFQFSPTHVGVSIPRKDIADEVNFNSHPHTWVHR